MTGASDSLIELVYESYSYKCWFPEIVLYMYYLFVRCVYTYGMYVWYTFFMYVQYDLHIILTHIPGS